MEMPWDDVISDDDRRIFNVAGWGRRAGFGERPALLVIDVNYNFCGDTEEPVLDSIKKWRYACGPQAWSTGIPAIQRVLTAGRAKRLPVIYTTNPRRDDGFDLGIWTLKSHRADDPVDVSGHKGNDIVTELAPEDGDLFIEKCKPSAFFGTTLMSHLNNLKADSLIVMGTTTSGCVRATAVDALSYDILVTIPHEAVFDRGALSHKVALLDLHMKYVDVTDTDEVVGYIEGLSTGIFDDAWPPAAKAAGSTN